MEYRKLTIKTVRDAREVLRPPLCFGDSSQIEARKFLEKVELAKEALSNCANNHWEATRYSDRLRGESARWMACCECVEAFPRDVREQAAIVLVDEWRPA